MAKHIHENEREVILLDVAVPSYNDCIITPIKYTIMLVLKCLKTRCCLFSCPTLVDNIHDLTDSFRCVGIVSKYKYTRENCCDITEYNELPDDDKLKDHILYMARKYHPQYTLNF